MTKFSTILLIILLVGCAPATKVEPVDNNEKFNSSKFVGEKFNYKFVIDGEIKDYEVEVFEFNRIILINKLSPLYPQYMNLSQTSDELAFLNKNNWIAVYKDFKREFDKEASIAYLCKIYIPSKMDYLTMTLHYTEVSCLLANRILIKFRETLTEEECVEQLMEYGLYNIIKLDMRNEFEVSCPLAINPISMKNKISSDRFAVIYAENKFLPIEEPK